MPVLLGVNDMKQWVLPLGWDGTELNKYAFADRRTYEDVINDIATALTVVNGQLLSDPILGGMISTTTELTNEYRSGGGNGMQKRGEYSRGDTRRAATIGGMFPLESYDRELGWTWDFLRKARSIQIEADVADAMQDVKDNWQKAVLTRFFSDTENLIGSGGYDVPFIKGAGAIQSIPVTYNGQSFAVSHSHFDRQTTSNQLLALENGAQTLWEHGITGPYTAIVPFADMTTWANLAGFLRPDRQIQRVRTDSGAVMGTIAIDEMYLGGFETKFGLVLLWATPRLPTNYLGMYRSYGAGDQRNPIKVRYSDDMGIGAVLMRGEGLRMFPLENALIIQEFGIGIADRLNGYAAFFAASGSYVVPTIS